MYNWAPVIELSSWLRPVLAGLDSFVHDWGLAVILLTILVRLLLFPMTVKQARFAWKNRQFSQAFRELSKQWKHDPDKLQEETKKLTMEQKYNPFVMMGTVVCQMPIFAAIYALFHHFSSSLSTFLVPWAHTLAVPDSLHVLPFLVAGISAAGTLVPMIEPEPLQNGKVAARVLVAAVVFSSMLFMLWKAPVAVAIYIAISSLWGMMERTFLRTPYAVQKLRIRPEEAGARTGEGLSNLSSESLSSTQPEIGKA